MFPTGGPSTGTSKEEEIEELDKSVTPDFIYGGPFIKVSKLEPFIDTITPINIQHQGTFKKSYAYYSLKERMPVILTRIIDQLAKKGDAQDVIARISKLKSELATNKAYSPLKVNTVEAMKWNKWIEEADNHYYFNNAWVFTECYIYRRLREALELTPSMKDFDPFKEQKEKTFEDNIETMCVVAAALPKLLGKEENWPTMLKLCLWSNKCDLSLTAGAPVTLAGELGAPAEGAPPEDPLGPLLLDPFEMIEKLKKNIVVDNTKKINLEALQKKPPGEISGTNPPPPRYNAKGKLIKEKKPPKPPPPPPPPPGAPPRQPCPAKVTVLGTPTLDIVCDNAGYELFADLCLADFVLSMKWVERVRFHVKKIPWFISDATTSDFKYLINACMNADYSRTAPVEQPKPVVRKGKAPPPDEGTPPPEPLPPRLVTSDALRQVAMRWKKNCDTNKFIVMCDEFWTSPHVYKDMAKYSYNLYRKLQLCVAIVFKGDLNYRKLLGDRNVNPVAPFKTALQAFNPAPIIALRTVKSEVICGMKKGKFEVQTKKDPTWMTTGDYGIIQFCKKRQKLKVATQPCLDYDRKCLNQVCPVHKDLW